MRIVLVSPLPPPPGGISRWTQGLLEFASQQHDVEIIHIDSAVRFRPVWNLGYAVRIAGGVLHSAALIAKYLRALLFQRADVVHLTTSGSLGFLRDIALIGCARVLRKPLVLHMHFGRLPAAVSSRHWQAKLATIACRMAGTAIALDRDTANAIRAIAPRSQVSVIGNPAWSLNVREARDAVRGRTDIVSFVGWVIPAKGVCELVEACRDIEDPPFRLELTGPVSGSFREHLRSIARQRDDGRWLDIAGPVDGSEAARRIARAAMLVLPSYTEGAPYVVLEAMALGTPVVATPVGAIPEILAFHGEGPCGVSVPARDSAALREAIRSLLTQPELARQLARRAERRVISEYSAARVFGLYVSAWRQACSRAGEAGRLHDRVIAE